jgi:hypothetical protein
MLLLERKIYFHIFCVQLDYVIGVYLVKILLLLIGQGLRHQALAYFSLEEFAISNASIFDHWSMVRCLLGYYTPFNFIAYIQACT